MSVLAEASGLQRPGTFWLFVWALTIVCAAAAGSAGAWAIGFRRGVRWARGKPNRRGPWPIRDRRKRPGSPPPGTPERRESESTARHRKPPATETWAAIPPQPPPPPPRRSDLA